MLDVAQYQDMHSNIMKWLVGSLAFLLPAAMAVIGKRLDRSDFRHDATYSALIPVAYWSSILLAIAIPTILVMRTRMSLRRRMGVTGVIWCLLLLEFYWIFLSVVYAH
jgi:hypothetical protein